MPSRLIEIPLDDIFKNDMLDLEPAIQVQSEALLSHSPQAIAIDGSWGSGKTTFMALWEAYLRREGVKVVTFNAWKFSLSDPLDALTKEILRQFEDVPGEQRQPAHRRLINFVLQSAPFVRQGLKAGAQFSPELAEVTDVIDPYVDSAKGMVGSAIGVPHGSEGATKPDDSISSPDAFTSALSSAASHWSDKPVVIMVDELDRCSPEYAVEMLQLLEHVFYADNIVFVVSMNRAELVHSVKAFYGQDFNADGYLERFFDNVFSLPSSNRLKYIQSSLKAIDAGKRGFFTPSALPFLYRSNLSLREIDRAVSQLDEALHSYTPARSGRGLELAYMWLVRTLAPVEYRQFMSGETTDKSLADAVFANGTCGAVREDEYEVDRGYALELEGVLILASYARSEDTLSGRRGDLFAHSALYAHHKSETDIDRINDGTSSKYSSRIVDHAAYLFQSESFRRYIFDIVKVTRLLNRDAVPN